MDPKVAAPGGEPSAAANRPASGGGATAKIAKATLLRLAQSRLEPTPENYAKAWVEAGGSAARAGDGDGAAWATLVDQLVRGLERRDRSWTAARKKESVQRVLDGSRSHPQRLRERMSQLVASWQSEEAADTPVETQPAELGTDTVSPSTVSPSTIAALAPLAAAGSGDWPSLAGQLERTVRAGLPAEEPESVVLSQALAAHAQRWEQEGSDAALLRDVGTTCVEVRRVFAQRHHLVDELGRLVRSLTEGLTELAEDESWARGQADAMRARIDSEGAPLSVRGVRSAADLLTQTRLQQQRLKVERDRARAALKALVDSLSAELEALGGQTGRFGDELTRCTEDLERADSREQLAAVVHQMLAASRQVQTEVAEASTRLASARSQADGLNERVRELEGELKRLSDEVSTDALTQVANRRGLAEAFEREQARCAREASVLTVGLLDVDNFKKLNDSLGHAAGDAALKALAAQVRESLRPVDHVARFGGEEFVVLLPGTAIAEAQEVLTRVQRGLSMALFMHEGREVFVTFSAGVTAWRSGENLDAAIERADAALYEAKRTGKNRTCVS